MENVGGSWGVRVGEGGGRKGVMGRGRWTERVSCSCVCVCVCVHALDCTHVFFFLGGGGVLCIFVSMYI